MRYIFVIGILLAFSGISISAQCEKPVWQAGTIVSNNYKKDVKTFEYTLPQYDMKTGMRNESQERKETLYMRDDNENIRVKTAEGTYILTRGLKFVWQGKIRTKGGDAVQITKKDDYVYLKTVKGKKFKYFLVGIEPVKNENDGQ